MPEHASSWQRIGHWISKITHHLPAALMVSALVGIGHHKYHMLDAIDGYAFLSIGNLAAKAASLGIKSHPTVAVVLIDQKWHEDKYRQRAPLDRCQLAIDLERIYTLFKPKLLVVDLDLSPALPVNGDAGGKNSGCESQLEVVLNKYHKTPTVLMEPSQVLDTEGQKEIQEWRNRLSLVVTFGNPTLNLSYGLLNTIGCKADSMAAAAFEKYNEPAKGENCLAKREQALRVSPGQYRSGLSAVAVSDLYTCQAESKGNDDPYQLPVVFFGGSYDDSDTYLTPVGQMYGVEVHAAAYMSLLQPTDEAREVLAFVLDIVLGLLLGRFIARCWQIYFALRFSDRARNRQMAPYAIFGLTLGLLVVVAFLTVVSFYLLRNYSIWLSPIPIAVGMLIESFFNSAIGEAVEEGYRQRQTLIASLKAAHDHGPGAFQQQVAHEVEQRPHHAHGLEERAARFFVLDFRRLRKTHQYTALAFLLLRRAAFFLLLAFYIWVSLL
ncbi:CHASE2 domain-containing protein [Pseudomonas sp. NA-150]|uniref:CHASE2 domain-containing protein n=1 Tax=Pseudomonas sp. NA-150 TaxID=3367525 RepID=UPI0037C53ACF